MMEVNKNREGKTKRKCEGIEEKGVRELKIEKLKNKNLNIRI